MADVQSNPVQPGQMPEVIRGAFEAIYAHSRKIERLKETHIKPIQDQRTRAWRDLKKETGIERKDLDLWYKLWEREKLADDLDDEEDRERIRDNLRIVYNALTKGEMVDFLDAMEMGGEGTQSTDLIPGDDWQRPQGEAEDDEDPSDGAAYGEGVGEGGDGAGEGDGDTAPEDDADGPEVVEDDAPVAAEAEVPGDAGTVFNQGAQAGLDGLTGDDNPYHQANAYDGTRAVWWEQGRQSTADDASLNRPVDSDPDLSDEEAIALAADDHDGDQDGEDQPEEAPARQRVQVVTQKGTEDCCDHAAAAALLIREIEDAEDFTVVVQLLTDNAHVTEGTDDLRRRLIKEEAAKRKKALAPDADMPDIPPFLDRRGDGHLRAVN